MIEVDSSGLREKLKKTTYELMDNARIKAYRFYMRRRYFILGLNLLDL